MTLIKECMMYFSEKHAPRPSSFCVSVKPIPESRHCVIAVCFLPRQKLFFLPAVALMR